MRRVLLILLAIGMVTSTAFAAGVEVKFKTIADLGVRKKPTVRIDSSYEALDFILADKIVRKSIANKIEQGYSNWVAKATTLVDGKDAVYEVRITSNSQLPPYACVFRFDAIGNDLREKPWGGCQYE